MGAMSAWQAIIFGVVEGLTEFLPVSSTAHLVLTAKWLGLEQTDFMKSFEIAIQLGAMLAVAVVYWRSFLQKPAVLKRVLAALVPTLVLGLFFYKIVRSFLSSETVAIAGLFIGGIILILFDRWYKEKDEPISDIEQVPYGKAVLIGVAQSVAMIPGVSRSGATIVGGLALGFKRRAIVEFSFLLGAPTIFAATALDILKNREAFVSSDWTMLSIGLIVSFVVALASIRFFLRYVQNNGLAAFGIYRIVIAAVFWIFVR